jgi:hypothetical protein
LPALASTSKGKEGRTFISALLWTGQLKITSAHGDMGGKYRTKYGINIGDNVMAKIIENQQYQINRNVMCMWRE